MKIDIKKQKLTKKYKLSKKYPLFSLKWGVRFNKKLAKEYDGIGYISMKLGKELEELWDKDYFIGIHRTGYSNIDGIIGDVFQNGLINNGDAMLGVLHDDPDRMIDIEKTVSECSDLNLLVAQLKTAHGYKNSEGSFIVKIPKSYLGREAGEIKPIYFKENQYTKRLLPEFIYGFVPCYENGKKLDLGEMVKNPNYTDVHDYDNEGLLYESDALYKMERGKSK